MNDPDQAPENRSPQRPIDSATAPAADPRGKIAGGDGPTPESLSPEEQMALYEKELKENDWGHQPC